MGLRNNAIHAMLANPQLAPFDVITRPSDAQDWTLVDHLVNLYKVKPEDYVENNPKLSMMQMAKTLARHYLSEVSDTNFLVLVKDGEQAQKPAIRDTRTRRTAAPHVDFCRRYLCAIEYQMLEMLADAGAKDKVALVTGAQGDCQINDVARCWETTMVSFHKSYAESEPRDRKGDDGGFKAERSTKRPKWHLGPFAATFAAPDKAGVLALWYACKTCVGTEADTLLVELANSLPGSVTVCSADSDVIAVLTARGRSGVILRMDNRSYRCDVEMHTSIFGDLILRSPEDQGETPPPDLSEREARFRTLCDLSADDVNNDASMHLRAQHDASEDALVKEYNQCPIDVAEYLVSGGIRGSLYSTYLSRRESSAAAALSLLVRAAKNGGRGVDVVTFLFETLYPCTRDSPNATRGQKRVASDYDNFINESKRHKSDLRGMKRLARAYLSNAVPEGSHGRFLKLTHSGPFLYLRIKESLASDEADRNTKLTFMALCGTDYNFVPRGLGIKSLLTGAITNRQRFSEWCAHTRQLLRTPIALTDTKCHDLALELAKITRISPVTYQKYWTVKICSLAIKTLAYTDQVWNLRKPKADVRYGLAMHADGVARFIR